MKKFIILLGLILLGSDCFAFDIVYPKKNDVTINAKSTFFIGSSDKPLKINGQNVPIHPSGGFAYVVNLVNGRNVFTLQTENERKIFVITKPVVKSICSLPPQFIQYNENKYVYVTTEGAPLRSTPVDAGINRIAHLQRDIMLAVDGEKSGFYRVILENNKYGWIAKTNVKLCENYNFESAQVLDYEYIDGKDYYTYVFHLTRQVPYEIIEGESLVLKFYNVKDDFTMDFPFKETSRGARLQGYSGQFSGNDFILKIRKPKAVKYGLRGLTIAIDAGHGGSEIGAVGCLGNKEKDITLIISKYLETELKKRGARVVMTRDDDVYTGLKDRVEKANVQEADVLLSIHGNALPDGADPNKISGTSVYYYYNQSKPLADVLINEMTTQLGTNNDKVRQASLALVRNTNALSLLIETAYLINPEDNAKLVNPEFQKNCAKAIADGLEKYFKGN